MCFCDEPRRTLALDSSSLSTTESLDIRQRHKQERSRTTAYMHVRARLPDTEVKGPGLCTAIPLRLSRGLLHEWYVLPARCWRAHMAHGMGSGLRYLHEKFT